MAYTVIEVCEFISWQSARLGRFRGKAQSRQSRIQPLPSLIVRTIVPTLCGVFASPSPPSTRSKHVSLERLAALSQAFDRLRRHGGDVPEESLEPADLGLEDDVPCDTLVRQRALLEGLLDTKASFIFSLSVQKHLAVEPYVRPRAGSASQPSHSTRALTIKFRHSSGVVGNTKSQPKTVRQSVNNSS